MRRDLCSHVPWKKTPSEKIPFMNLIALFFSPSLPVGIGMPISFPFFFYPLMDIANSCSQKPGGFVVVVAVVVIVVVVVFKAEVLKEREAKVLLLSH